MSASGRSHLGQLRICVQPRWPRNALVVALDSHPVNLAGLDSAASADGAHAMELIHQALGTTCAEVMSTRKHLQA